MTTPAHFDEAAVARYIHRIFAPYVGEPVRVGFMTALRPVPGQKKPELAEVRRTNLPYPAQVGEIVRRLAVAAGQGREIYLSPMPWINEKQQAPQGSVENLHQRCWWLWSDVDAGDHAKLPPTILVETSPGRFAGLWRLSEPVDPAAAAELSARVALHIGADPSGADLTQVLRIPGTANLSRPGCPVVRLVDDDGPVYDAAILAEMLPPAPRRSRPSGNHFRSGEQAVDPEDLEPPVPLSDDDYATWMGEHPIVTPDGVIDRSKTLMRIARRLYEAGLAGRYLAGEIAAADARLGYRKYTNRADAATRYAEMAAEIIGSGRTARLVRLPVPSGNDCRSEHEAGDDVPENCDNEACRIEKAQLRRELERLQLRERGRRNRKGLGAAAAGAAEIAQALADVAANRTAAPETGFRIDVFRLERETGVDAKTLRTHARTVAANAMSDDDCERFGVAPGTPVWNYHQVVEPKPVRTPDGRTIVDGTITRVFLLPNVAPELVQEAIASATLPKAPRAGNPGCKLHPDAPTYTQKSVQVKVEKRCSVCHEVIRTKTEHVRTYTVQPDEAAAVDWSDEAGDEAETPSGNDFRSGENAPGRGNDPLSSTVDETAARERSNYREAARLLNLLRVRNAMPRLVADRFVYDENQVSESVQGEVNEVLRELADLLVLERDYDENGNPRPQRRRPRRGGPPDTGEAGADRWTA